MGTHNSRLGGFYKLSPSERLHAIEAFDGLCDEDQRQLRGRGAQDAASGRNRWWSD
jgi:hydroxymethylglutaryl-CoA reductase